MDNTNRQRPLAVVTGASSGIGLEIAQQLGGRGYDVVAAAEDDHIDGVAGAIRTNGVEAHGVRVDLRTPEGCNELATRVRELGTPEVLVINAGVGLNGPFVETDLAEHVDLVNLNVTGALHLAHMLIGDMVRRGQGHVMFTSSVAATSPGPYMATYNASKAFVQSFSQALRVELKDAGVTVTALMPGPTDTHFFERAHLEDTRMAHLKRDDPADVAREGIEAMLAGVDHVVTGSALNKVQVATSAVTPERILAAAQAKLSKPGTG